MIHKNGTVGSCVGFRRGTAVYSISVSGFPRTFKNDGWHAVLRFLFVKGSMRGWWKEKKEDYEDRTLSELQSSDETGESA